MTVQLGTVLAALFVVALVVAAVLAILAVLEHVPGRKNRQLFYRWRTPGSRFDRFLEVNAAVNEVLSLLATVALITWTVLDTATTGFKQFLVWSQVNALGAQAFWLILILYVLLGATRIVSELVTDEAHPLISRALNRVLGLVKGREKVDRELEAQLTYSYGPGLR